MKKHFTKKENIYDWSLDRWKVLIEKYQSHRKTILVFLRVNS